MASKRVVDRARSSATVGASLDAHADEIGTKFGAVLAPLLRTGESMPDTALFMRLLGRHVAQRSAALTEMDAANETELADDATPRSERDAAELALRQHVSRYRGAIGDAWGDEGLRVFGIWEAAPPSSRGVARYALDFAAALRDPSRAPSGSPPPGLAVDRPVIAGVLDAGGRRLEAALAVVTREEAEAGATQTAKDRALAENDAAFLSVARIAEAALTLAGRADLAERVRPSVRKPGLVEDEEGGGGAES